MCTVCGCSDKVTVGGREMSHEEAHRLGLAHDHRHDHDHHRAHGEPHDHHHTHGHPHRHGGMEHDHSHEHHHSQAHVHADGVDHRHGNHDYPHYHGGDDHAHGHDHRHDAIHDHRHYGLGPAGVSVPGMSQRRLVEVETSILAKNDALAAGNRRVLRALGVLALNLVSRLGQDDVALQDCRGARRRAAGRDRGRPADQRRCRPHPRHRRARDPDQHGKGLPPRRRDGRPRHRRPAAAPALLPVHRECRQSRLPGRLRSGRGRQGRHPVGDGGRGQTAEISRHVHRRTAGGAEQGRPGAALRRRPRHLRGQSAPGQPGHRDPPPVRSHRRGHGGLAVLAAHETGGEGVINASRPTVLLVDDEPHSLSAMRMALEDEFDCATAADAEAAIRQMEQHWVQVVVCDQRMPGRTGVELLTHLRERWPETVRIIVTGYTDPSAMAHAINEAGIHQFLTKPWHPEQLLVAVRNGARLASLARENERLALEMRVLASTAQTKLDMRRAALREKMGFETILRTPQSPMNALIKVARHHASFDIPVLITGESGVGRGRLARAMHLASLRSDRPYFALNLAGLTDEIAAAELFGVKRGAVAGASYRYGLVKKADRGTLFIKGIEHAGPVLQMELWRLLAEGTYTPIGGQELAIANVRIIAAAGTDLPRRIADGAFRSDLYYALSVAELAVPPLRNRRGDVAILAQAFLEDLSARHGKAAQGFTQAALDFLSHWDWPGNLKELQNEITRMLVFAQSPVLGAELISRPILQAAPSDPGSDRFGDGIMTADGTLKDRVERIEMRILRETLTRHRWNKSRAAAELGLSRVGLRAKLDRYGIADPSGRVTEEEED